MNIQDIPDDATGQAIKRWALEGSDLTKPMKINFFVAVNDAAMGKKVTAEPVFNNFDISIEQGDGEQWTCYCAIEMVPDYQAIVDIEDMLSCIAERFGAVYDCFGSFGNAGEPVP